MHVTGTMSRLLAFVGGLCTVASALQAQPCVSASDAKSAAPPITARFPSFLTAWQTRYPTSTLPNRTDALTGSACFICHHPPTLSEPGNCYRTDLTNLLNQGLTIEQAIDQLDGEDSDGDGVPNGVEATTPRPEAGEVGYNMGLVGDTGTDPCGTDPASAVTGVPETPTIEPIPTVSQWGLVVMSVLVLTAGTIVLAHRRRVQG